MEGIAIMKAKERERATLAVAAQKLRDLESPDAGLGATSTPDRRGRATRTISSSSLTPAESEELDKLLELPEGWESKVSPEGITFYIDHRTQTTTWVHPSLREAAYAEAKAATKPGQGSGAAPPPKGDKVPKRRSLFGRSRRK